MPISNEDRYISLRPRDNYLTSHFKLNYNDEEVSHTYYIETLLNKLNLRPQTNVLQFSNHAGNKSDTRAAPSHVLTQWPTKPRKKSDKCSETPYAEFKMFPGRALENVPQRPFDWSSTGEFAIICALHHLQIMPADLERPGSIYQIPHGIFCVKWNNASNKLATLNIDGILRVMNYINYELLCNNKSYRCNCKGYRNTSNTLECRIRTFDWRRDDAILAGCSDGTLTIWQNHCKIYRMHVNSEIVNIKSSINDHYFAVDRSDGILNVIKWPVQPFCQNKGLSTSLRNAMAWHPWKETILARATKNLLIILNIASRKVVATKEMEPHTQIQALTWNNVSGELVVSLSMKNGEHAIIILSDLEHVVQHMSTFYETSLFAWNSCGTILASGNARNFNLRWFIGREGVEKRRVKMVADARQNVLSIHYKNFGNQIR